jgi:hypothetical protein
MVEPRSQRLKSSPSMRVKGATVNKDYGEIYFIRERSFETEDFPTFVKIGLVKQNDKRTSFDRLLEHQTGNPRRLQLSHDLIVQTYLVSKVETNMHGRFARKRVLNEWFEVKSEESLLTMIAMGTTLAADAELRVVVQEKAEEFNQLSDNNRTSPPTEEAITTATELCVEDKKLTEIKKIEKTIIEKLRTASDLDIDVRGAISLTEVKKKFSLDKKNLESDHPELYAQYVFDKDGHSRTFNYTKFRNSILLEKALDYEEFTSTMKEIEDSVDQIIAPEEAYKMNPELLRLTEIKSMSEWKQDGLKRQLQVQCGENLEIEGICKWSRKPETKKQFNESEFSENNPDIYQQYQSETPATTRMELTRWQIRR